jgi:hypothetical protein
MTTHGVLESDCIIAGRHWKGGEAAVVNTCSLRRGFLSERSQPLLGPGPKSTWDQVPQILTSVAYSEWTYSLGTRSHKSQPQ